MTTKFMAAVGVLVAAAVAAAPASVQAGIAAQPGDVCNVAYGHGNVAVASAPNLANPLYWIAPGGGFRIEAYGDNYTYYGHGNGQPSGYMGREFINQSSCH